MTCSRLGSSLQVLVDSEASIESTLPNKGAISEGFT